MAAGPSCKRIGTIAESARKSEFRRIRIDWRNGRDAHCHISSPFRQECHLVKRAALDIRLLGQDIQSDGGILQEPVPANVIIMGIPIHSSETSITNFCRNLVHTEDRAIYIIIPHLERCKSIIIFIKLPVHHLHLRTPFGILLLQEKGLRGLQSKHGTIEPEVQRRHSQTDHKQSSRPGKTRHSGTLLDFIQQRSRIQYVFFIFGHTGQRYKKTQTLL